MDISIPFMFFSFFQTEPILSHLLSIQLMKNGSVLAFNNPN